MLEALIGAVGGGILRLVPEVIKWSDRAAERGHELSMLDAQYKLTALEVNARAAVEREQTDAAVIRAIADVSAAQTNARSGVAWADALNVLVRPVLAFSFFGLYLLNKAYAESWAWNDTDYSMLSGILSFFYIGRVYEKSKL